DGKHFEEVNLNQEEEEVSSSQTQGSIHSTSSTYTEPDNFDDAAITGQIEFAVQYNFKTATLEILIKACKHLASGDEKKKKLNPYVKTYLLPDKSSQAKSKTAVKKNTVNPVFNETLKYKIERSMLETRTLQVSVWHCTALKRNTFLGEVSIPLETWKFEEISTQSYNWYQLRTKVTSVRKCSYVNSLSDPRVGQGDHQPVSPILIAIRTHCWKMHVFGQQQHTFISRPYVM
uniref:C2 domain-containing protein n=1 Tax=Callorhinchus milii TaxID=7868 RepID=A0A4W3IP25_CALMI